ncbi:MAG TPA: GDSL-type esterase/lipase family protein, partial [Ilumatobacter sp.]|nr:GDSL-type esterase/lipase family protein [Ilumatobacter sp.]
MDGAGVTDRVARQLAARPERVAAVCLLGGIGALFWAASASTVWPVLVGAVIGIVAISASLLWVNDEFGKLLGDTPPRSMKIAFICLVLVGLGMIWVAVHWNSEVFGIVATLIVALAVMGWHTVWRTQGPGEGPAASAFVRPVALIVVGVLVAVFLGSVTPVAWLGLVLAFYGVVDLKQTSVSLVDLGRVGVQAAVWWGIGSTIGGVIAVYVGARWSIQLSLLFGVMVMFAGLSVVGLALVQIPCSRSQGWRIAAVGAALLAVGAAVAMTVLRSAGAAAVLFAFVVVLSSWFVWRGEGIILVVLIGFIAVWGMTDPATAEPLDPHPDSDMRILAIGDSFISGEGADRYFPGTNQVGDERNECRRAATAHPYLVASDLEASLTFVACSGAKAADLTRCGQMAKGDERCKDEWTDDDRAAADSVAGLLPQLANFTPAEFEQFDVVLLSIGGNDVGFSTIVQACLLPRSCDERRTLWLNNVEALGETLINTYQAVIAKVPDTPVIVIPYPLVVDAHTCGLGLDASEHAFVRDFTTALNEQIAISAAAVPGVQVYEEGAEAMAGHRLCKDGSTRDHKSGINHIDLDPAGGSLARYLPSAWIHGSMHPNPHGHRLIARGDASD